MPQYKCIDLIRNVYIFRIGNDVSLRKEHIENHLHEYMSDLD